MHDIYVDVVFQKVFQFLGILNFSIWIQVLRLSPDLGIMFYYALRHVRMVLAKPFNIH